MSVTPDPGVIEVNVAPTSSFRRAEGAAGNPLRAGPARAPEHRGFRLRTAPTGVPAAANHITLGGITPADSPLLRRPDLLVSLLTYWQRHPSLVLPVFPGRFVGTTSQAPRVDEGRPESLYELDDRVRRDRAG